MKLKLSWKTFLYSALMTFLFAALGGIVTYLGMPFFEQVKQPPLSPPAIIYDSDNPNAPKALLVYLVQLTMNFWWCVFFFGFRMYLFSFIWLLLLMIAVVVMIILFTRINRLAGFIQLGYLLWLCFAAYLNFGIWFLNR